MPFIPNSSINEDNITTTQQQQNGTVSVIQSPMRKQIIAIKPKVKRKVAELKCAEVRWFYRRKDDTKWTPFKGYDSTVLEIAYRKSKNIELDDATKQNLSTFPERVILMDGNYVADEELKNINAIYWKEDTYLIRRGTWFYVYDMQPMSPDFSDAIETHHIKCFKDNVIPETPVFSESESSRKPVLTTIKWEGETICWNSVVDVHIAAQRSNAVVRFLTRSRGPIPLQRCYSERANPNEGRPNFSDLILVIHGIGQKGYENLIAKNTAQIRDALIKQMEKYYPNEKRRPAILPIEWRSLLQLDNGLTDIVTLPKMPEARNVLNSVCMDLMYYQSPLYRTEIVNGVIKSLNGVYSTFIENNPGFSGPISIVGHSLGSVIAYDILTNWSPFLLYDQFVTNAIEKNIKECSSLEQKHLEQFYNSKKKILELDNTMEQILIRHEEPLKFKVKFLFCLGSPLAIFCIMRGADYKTVIPRPDQVERIFNIFHPYDPVAYRIEPMFHENYKHIRPLKLFHHQSAIKNYENVIFECHRSYLNKCKTPHKKEKDGTKSAKKAKKGGNGRKSEESDGKNEKSSNDKYEEHQQQKAKPITDEDDEQQHFMDDTDSDLEMASSTYTTGDASTPRSVTPQQNTESSVLTVNFTQPETPSTTKATPSTPFAPLTAENLESCRKMDEARKIGDELPAPEQGVEAAEEEVEEEEEGEGEALHANDGSQMKLSPLDDLKKMGEAGRLIEQIPPERRISQRIDFQVQPWVLDKSYWSMLKSHFSYWSNLDVAAFLLNAIYPPPLEVTGVAKL